LIGKLRQLSAGGGSQRRGGSFGCQWPSGTETAASGFRIACGGNLAAGRRSRLAVSERNRPKLTENQQVTLTRKHVTIDNMWVSNGDDGAT
jgi:hypothetical protein